MRPIFAACPIDSFYDNRHAPDSFYEYHCQTRLELNRRVASPTRTKAIGDPFELGLPLRFQGIQADRLQGPVGDDGYAKGAQLAIAFGDVHTTGRFGGPWLMSHQSVNQLAPGFGRLDDDPIYARCVLSRIHLGHPTHRKQCVG
jgi:hypothetical protein